jgi:hypothetical protein
MWQAGVMFPARTEIQASIEQPWGQPVLPYPDIFVAFVSISRKIPNKYLQIC